MKLQSVLSVFSSGLSAKLFYLSNISSSFFLTFFSFVPRKLLQSRRRQRQRQRQRRRLQLLHLRVIPVRHLPRPPLGRKVLQGPLRIIPTGMTLTKQQDKNSFYSSGFQRLPRTEQMLRPVGRQETILKPDSRAQFT